ncbi:MAG: response regulator [Syntrophobacteraceae bacterium]
MDKWKVLLVDDEEEFTSALAERLALRGFEVQVAHSGEEALGRISAATPQVVVLDKMMPGMGGAEVQRLIKKDHPQIQVIFLTGQGCMIDEAEKVHLGAFDCLIKPVDIEELMGSIRAAVTTSALKP